MSESKTMGLAHKKVMKGIGKEADKNKFQFQGWAMSIMFAGMAIKQMSMQAWQFGAKAFREISESVEGSTNGFMMLEGSMKYLGFTIGQALEPLAIALMPLIDHISEIIIQNPKLASGIIGWGVALGTIFSVGGSGALALNGFAELGTKMGLLVKEGDKLIAGGVLKKLGAFMISPAGLGIAALIALGAISWKSLKETPEAMASIKNSLKVLNEPLNNMKESFEGLINKFIPGFKLGWEDIAWVIAMAVHNAVPLFKVFADALSVIFDLLGLMVPRFKMVAQIMTGDWRGALSSIKEQREEVKELKDDLVSFFSNVGGLFTYEYATDLEQFKKDELAKQAIQNALSKGGSSDYMADYENSQQQSININGMSIYVNPEDNMSDFLNNLKSYSS